MAKNLLIVESPAKAKTIEGYLGKDFTVKSSYGHIRDLVKSEDAIDVANNFKQTYEVPADKKQVVSELKKLAKEADMVWLASDEDREGEAISWHLFETLSLKDATTKRIVFHEITKPAIMAAIDNPRKIDYNLVNAQQAIPTGPSLPQRQARAILTGRKRRKEGVCPRKQSRKRLGR